MALGELARQIGLPLRAGLHTGEVEMRGNDIGGIAVHVAARIMGRSGANEVFVSRVVTDLVAGAGLRFTDRGSFDLKGLPGSWDLFAAQPEAYRTQVLPPGVAKLAVEAASPFGWDRWVDDVVGIDRYGASAPGPVKPARPHIV